MSDDDRLGPLALDIMMLSRVHDLEENALAVGCIYAKVTREMPDVVSVNGNPQKRMFGYWALAAMARDDRP